MAGLGAAFLFVPLFYYLGVPLEQATSTALFLNVISLLFATINYWRSGLVNLKVGLPILITAVLFAPLGARLTSITNKTVLLGLFAGFLIFAGSMMLFYRPAHSTNPISNNNLLFFSTLTGGFAGFLGGLLGVGGGNFVLPFLNWIGLEAKIASATTALVVVASSFSGFLGHATMQNINPVFISLTAITAAGGSILGSYLMKNRLTNTQLKKIIGIILWIVAIKIIVDLF
ncbi:predicted permeases [Bellilinea caldifistulae]|nr:predicted permeases [Bellilinea caldifistulae]